MRRCSHVHWKPFPDAPRCPLAPGNGGNSRSTRRVAPMTTFGQKLRQMRTERDMSLTQLANIVHYNKGYMSRIETGQKQPTEDVARACDIALDSRGELITAPHSDIFAHQ